MTNQMETNVRRMLKIHSPIGDVESVWEYARHDNEFAGLIYRTPEEYDKIIDWLTEPNVTDFRIHLVYVRETSTRVFVALIESGAGE